ncbi:hypothetical protein ACVH9Z_27850 [Rhodococcus opacus]
MVLSHGHPPDKESRDDDLVHRLTGLTHPDRIAKELHYEVAYKLRLSKSIEGNTTHRVCAELNHLDSTQQRRWTVTERVVGRFASSDTGTAARRSYRDAGFGHHVVKSGASDPQATSGRSC